MGAGSRGQDRRTEPHRGNGPECEEDVRVWTPPGPDGRSDSDVLEGVYVLQGLFGYPPNLTAERVE